MADKYKVITTEVTENPSVDAWKDKQVEKEYQPPKIKEPMSYRQKGQEVASIDEQIASLQARKNEVEKEMVEIKKVAE